MIERRFMASSNVAETMRELARSKPQYSHQCTEYADDLDVAVEAYVIGGTRPHLDKMLSELSYCGKLYTAITGQPMRLS